MIYDFYQIIPGITVKGIDISSYAIENCIEDMKEHVQIADARELPFDDNSFNKIASVSTVEHFNDPELGLSEMARVLDEKGVLSISVDSLNDENSNE